MNRSFALLLTVLAPVACAHTQTTSNERSVSSVSITSAALETSLPPSPAVSTEAPVMSMGEWKSRFPDAAMVLSTWAHDHPGTASALAAWQRANPIKMKVLIDWSVTNVHESLSAFFMNRSGWGDLQALADRDGSGLDGFLSWTRAAPTAATALDWQPSVLTAAAQHPETLAVNAAAAEAGTKALVAPQTSAP